MLELEKRTKHFKELWRALLEEQEARKNEKVEEHVNNQEIRVEAVTRKQKRPNRDFQREESQKLRKVSTLKKTANKHLPPLKQHGGPGRREITTHSPKNKVWTVPLLSTVGTRPKRVQGGGTHAYLLLGPTSPLNIQRRTRQMEASTMRELPGKLPGSSTEGKKTIARTTTTQKNTTAVAGVHNPEEEVSGLKNQDDQSTPEAQLSVKTTSSQVKRLNPIKHLHSHCEQSCKPLFTTKAEVTLLKVSTVTKKNVWRHLTATSHCHLSSPSGLQDLRRDYDSNVLPI